MRAYVSAAKREFLACVGSHIPTRFISADVLRRIVMVSGARSNLATTVCAARTTNGIENLRPDARMNLRYTDVTTVKRWTLLLFGIGAVLAPLAGAVAAAPATTASDADLNADLGQALRDLAD